LYFYTILSKIFAICQPQKMPKTNGGFMIKKVLGVVVVAALCWENVALGGVLVQCCYKKNEVTGIYEPVTAESCLKCPAGCNDLCFDGGGGFEPNLECDDECKGLTEWGAPNGIVRLPSYETRCNVTYCQYRCKAGFYGSGKNCQACPGNAYFVGALDEEGTSDVGAKKITECYSVSGKDTSGDFVFSPPCYYSE